MLTDARSSAVRVHEEDAAKFAAWYRTSGFDNAFTCGRTALQRHFENCLGLLNTGARILDVGCGIGQQALELQTRGFDVNGIDPAASMLSLAHDKLKDRVLDGSILNIPFPDNSFDFVYSLEVFRYLDSTDNVKGLQEMLRVLKPGGVFFSTFVNRWALDGFFVFESARKILRKSRCHHEFETPTSLKSRLESLDFVQVETHGAMFAALRILYKANESLGQRAARALARLEPVCDWRLCQGLAGHLIATGRKKMG